MCTGYMFLLFVVQSSPDEYNVVLVLYLVTLCISMMCGVVQCGNGHLILV